MRRRRGGAAPPATCDRPRGGAGSDRANHGSAHSDVKLGAAAPIRLSRTRWTSVSQNFRGMRRSARSSCWRSPASASSSGTTSCRSARTWKRGRRSSRRCRHDIAKGQATAKQLPEFRAEVDDLEARLGSLRAVLPEEKDAADLLRRMQTVATQSNLTIKSFKPAPPVTKQLHAEWPIALELEGTYHNLAIFFDRVGKFTRIVNITGLDVQGKEPPDPNATIIAQCVATTFVLLDKPAPPKPGATPAAAAAKTASVSHERDRFWSSLVLMHGAVRRRRRAGRRPRRQAAGAGATASAAAASRHRDRTPTTPTAGAIRSSACSASEPNAAARRDSAATGWPGMTVAEISVRGILQSRGDPDRDGAGT